MKYLILFLSFTIIIACNNDKTSQNGQAVTVTDTDKSIPKLSDFNKSEPSHKEHVVTSDTPKSMKDYIPPSTPIPEDVKKTLADKPVKEPITKTDVARKISSKKKSVKKSDIPVTKKRKKRKKQILKQIEPKPIETVKAKGKLYFLASKINFGILIEGDEIDKTFTCINTGQAPITINNVEVSCGCTTPEFSFLAIPPGRRSTIKVHYSTYNKWGHQKPMLTVHTDGDPAEYHIFLEGDVHEDPDDKPAKTELSETIDTSKSSK